MNGFLGLRLLHGIGLIKITILFFCTGNLSPFGLLGGSLLTGFSPFGNIMGGGIQNMFEGMNDLFANQGSFTQTSFSSSSAGGSGGGVRSTSTSTR